LIAGEDRADIFANVKGRASTPPDVLIGPDSNCTLSFTSGTQGLPKYEFLFSLLLRLVKSSNLY
jgi:L-aminoadipate-semialdehyde dehydrogenase